MAAREHFSAEVLTESTFTSATVWGSACPLTCTLASGADYIVWWSLEMVNRTSILNDAECRMTVDGVAMAEFNIEYRSIATEIGGYSGFFKITGNGSPMALDIEIQAEVAGSNIVVRNRRLVVMKMGPGDVYAENLPSTAVDVASTWADVVSLSFTPDAGDYLVIGHSMTVNYATTPPVYGTLVFDGVTDIDSRVATNGHAEVASGPTRAPLWKQWKRTVSASGASRTVRFQLHSHNTGNTIWGNENRLLILRLNDFDHAFYADLGTLTSVTSTTPTSVLSMTPTVSANPHLLIGSAYVTATSNINDLVYWQTSVDGVPLASPIVKPYSVTASRGQQVGSTALVTPSAGAKTISMDLWTDGSGTVIARPGSVITVLDLGSVVTTTPATANPGAGSLALTGYAPSVSAAAKASPAVGTLTFTGYIPTVSAGKSATASPSAGSLSITGYAPTVSAGAKVSPSAGTIAFTGHAPTVRAGATAVVQAGQPLVITGFAPTVTAGAKASPLTGSLTLTGHQPTVRAGATATPPLPGSLAIQGHAPTVSAGASVQPSAGSLTITGYAPTVEAGGAATAQVLPGSLTITGHAPTVKAGASVTVPAAATIVITGYAPTVSAGARVTPSNDNLVITGHAPTVSAGAKAEIQPAQIVFTGYAPTVSGAALAQPVPGALVITGYAPTSGRVREIPNRKARTVSISRSSRTAKLRTARRIVRFRPTG